MRTVAESVVLLPDLCQGFLQIGLSLLVQSTLLLLVGLGAGAALRRHSPVLACLVYRAAFLGVLLGALLSVSLSGCFQPFWSLSLPPAQEAPALSTDAPSLAAGETPSAQAVSEWTGASQGPVEPLIDARGRTVTVEMDTPGPRPAPAGVSAWPFPPFRDFLRPDRPLLLTSRVGWLYVGVTGVWLGGALGLLAWLLLCCRGIGQLLRRSAPVTDEEIQSLLRDLCAGCGVRPPRLLQCREVESVFLTGVWRPAILLPATYAAEFDAPALRAILAHEVAHLARRDPAWNLFARLLCAAAWVQPLLWVLRRQWEEVQEELCDLAVLQQREVTPRAYADCLLRLAERLSPAGPQRIAGMGIILFRSSLGRRVERLLASPSRPGLSPPARARWALGLGMAGAVMVAPFLVSAAAAPGTASAAGGATDMRLDRPVTIVAEGIPVGELIPLLARKSGLSLAVSQEMADEKVIILGPARPLKEVMPDLAALLNAFWMRTKATDGQNRYTLMRDLKAIRYEEQLGRANELRLLAQLEAQVKALPETSEALARRPENDPIRQALSTPGGRAATQIFALLTPRKRQQLLERWYVRLPVSALSESLKDQIGDLFRGPRLIVSNGLTVTPIPREEMDRHELAFSIWGARGTALHSGDLRVLMTAPTGLDQIVTRVHTSAKFLLPPHGNPYTGQKIEKAEWLPEPKRVPAAAADAWPDRLRHLAEKTGLPLMSDYYRSKPIHVAAAGEDEQVSPRGTPEGALDAFCRPEGYLWWTRGRTLLFRKRDWYNQRQYEVPDRWVLALAQRLKAQKGVPTVADVLTLLQLSTHQMVGLSESLGRRSNRQMLAGLRELLAVVAAAPGNKSDPVFSGVLVAGTSGSLAIRPDLRDPRQRALLQRFVEADNRGLSSEEAFSEEFGVVLHSPDPRFNEPGGEYRSLSAFLYMGGGSIRVGYPLALPLSLPDDRRDRTRIEIGS